MIKKIIQLKLAFLARLFLRRFKPRIVAVTGSVGKTSTKEAIEVVLRKKYKVRASQANYNNEIGVPLAIIGEFSAGRSVIGWTGVFFKALFKLSSNNYPEILVLEMGADKPGDIGYLCDMVGKLEVGVITNIGTSHLQFFSDQAELAKEKLTLIRKLKGDALAVLNFDSPKIYEGRTTTKAQVLGIGFHPAADVKVTDFQLINASDVWGANFKVHYKGTVVPFFIPNGLGKPAVYAALAATGVGLHFGLNLVEVSEALKTFQPPPGRLRLIKGIKRTTILDDTYNSAPASVIAALEVLDQIAPARKIAALGAMAELARQKQRRRTSRSSEENHGNES
jgi:UDP-N-acetylmuramyl pentapeptide synthase